jgi:hypothetical protein
MSGPLVLRGDAGRRINAAAAPQDQSGLPSFRNSSLVEVWRACLVDLQTTTAQ